MRLFGGKTESAWINTIYAFISSQIWSVQIFIAKIKGGKQHRRLKSERCPDTDH